MKGRTLCAEIGTTVNKYGVEFPIDNVQLDIAIPKGYDTKKLDAVQKATDDAKVKINIFETEN